jgi:hypothetical protein
VHDRAGHPLRPLAQPECRTLARHGPVYSPYKQQRDMQTSAGLPGSAQAQPAAVPIPAMRTGGDAMISVAERPIGTFPESVQNRYGGG